MSIQPRPYLTRQEYLVRERQSEVRHEYFAGEVFAMVGASRNHNQICFNISIEIGQQIKARKCVAYANDMRVRVDQTGLYTYPDLVITCEEPVFEDDKQDTLMNPQVIIEVLSESTEKYDRGKKFQNYRQLESLREYVLVSQEEPVIECYVRQPGGEWLLKSTEGLDATVELGTVGCHLPMAEVFAKVNFEGPIQED